MKIGASWALEIRAILCPPLCARNLPSRTMLSASPTTPAFGLEICAKELPRGCEELFGLLSSHLSVGTLLTNLSRYANARFSVWSRTATHRRHGNLRARAFRTTRRARLAKRALFSQRAHGRGAALSRFAKYLSGYFFRFDKRTAAGK